MTGRAFPASPSLLVAPIVLTLYIYRMHMTCRNLCERLYSKNTVRSSNYQAGGKYCRRCEVYFYCNDFFCPCCGMRLRLSPTTKKGKERLRQSRLGGLFRQRKEDEVYKLIKMRADGGMYSTNTSAKH